jgi:hypothetical protein
MDADAGSLFTLFAIGSMLVLSPKESFWVTNVLKS